jgi:hypothetical protein
MFPSQQKHGNDQLAFIHRPSSNGQPSSFPEQSIHANDIHPTIGQLCNDLPHAFNPE